MKKYLITTIIAFAAIFSMNGQETNAKVKKGDLLEIIKPSGNEFKYINFPRKNFILKRGGIGSNQLVIGKEVIVTEVTKEENHSTTIRIKKTDGGRFYNVVPSVTVNFEEAVKSGEIKLEKN